MKKRVFIGIGSNLGCRKTNIRNALTLINDISNIVNISHFYRFKPYGITNQPDFINLVVETNITYQPIEYLKLLQEIEKKDGERISKEKWKARSIDLDILFFDNIVMVSRELIVPHPDLHNRDFVLKPLMDIDPYFIHPVLKMTVQELYDMYCKNY